MQPQLGVSALATFCLRRVIVTVRPRARVVIF